MESNSPFRFAKHIRLGEPLTTDEMKEFQPYLMAKLYYYAGYHQYSNFLNALWSLPKEFQYKLFCILFKGITPHGWIKADKKKETNSLVVEYLKKKYQVSTKVAREYYELLNEKERKDIKRRYE